MPAVKACVTAGQGLTANAGGGCQRGVLGKRIGSGKRKGQGARGTFGSRGVCWEKLRHGAYIVDCCCIFCD